MQENSLIFILSTGIMCTQKTGNVTVMGTTEDVGDRKYNNGEVVNTLPKFTEEEKAYDPHFDLQQQR